jgi:hypothetical protein
LGGRERKLNVNKCFSRGDGKKKKLEDEDQQLGYLETVNLHYFLPSIMMISIIAQVISYVQ